MKRLILNTKATFLSLFVIALLLPAITFAQLTGIKTIPGSYATLAAAITDLNTQGVGGGGVTFNISAGYTEAFSSATAGLITATGTSGNPIVFQKNGAGAKPLITATTPGTGTTDYIIALSGTDYITFDGIDIKENPANTNATQQMEWGYALLKKSASDGSQNVTIKNCSITLNKANTISIGINADNHTPASTSALTISSTSGANSNNKFYSDTISNTYTAISATGYNDLNAPYTYYDQSNEIGVGGGNVITNFAGSSATAYIVNASYQNNVKIANNNINGGPSTTGDLRAICIIDAHNANVDIYANTITLTNSGAALLMGISFLNQDAGITNTVNIHDNVLQNFAVKGFFSIIYLSRYDPLNLNVYNNVISGLVSTVTVNSSAEFMFLQCEPVNADIYGNSIFNNTYATLQGSYGLLFGFLNGTGQWKIHDNNVYSNSNTAAIVYPYSFAPLFINAYSTDFSCYDNNIYSNTLPNTASAEMYGICCPTNGNTNTLLAKFYNNNVFDLTNNGNGKTYGIYFYPGNPNYVNHLIYNNNVYSIHSNGGGPVYGIYEQTTNSSGPAPVYSNIYGNHVYALSSDKAGGTVYGIYADASGSLNNVINVYNNMVSDLSAILANNTNAINGLYLTGSAGNDTVNVSYNSIYLNASSSGTNFGTSGIYSSTTPFIRLTNNLVVNNSTASGTGLTVTHRRSSSIITGLTADYNDYYAGTPATSNVIGFDGSTSYQTLANYQGWISEPHAVTADVGFSSNSDLHETNMGNSAPIAKAGIPVPNITTDIDGDPRNGSTPDIGADEFSKACVVSAGVIFSNKDTICENSSATLLVNGSTAPVQWQSSINGINFADISNADSVVYSSAFAQTTYLRVVANNGTCSDTTPLIYKLNVVAPPTADFTSSYNGTGCAFTYTSSGAGISTYSWNFGDGTILSNPNPVHAFQTSVDTIFNVCLTAYNGSNCSYTICHDVANARCFTALQAVSEKDDLNIYPNPNKGIFTVHTNNNPGTEKVEVFNITGQLIFQNDFKGKTEHTIDISQFGKGVYILHVTSEKQVICRKIVVQ